MDRRRFFRKNPTERQVVQEVGKELLVGIYNARQREDRDLNKYFEIAINQLRYANHYFEPIATQWMRLINEENYFASVWLNKLKNDEKYNEMLKKFVKALRLAHHQLGDKYRLEVEQ